jgi:diguanylate cyclase
MAAQKNPTDIARETVKQLASQRIPPTPENYQRIYAEVSGVPPKPEAEGLEQALQGAIQKLSKKTPEIGKLAKPLEKALTEHDWNGLEEALLALTSGGKSDEVSWADLIRELNKQMERRHSGITAQRKKEGLERVLINFSSDAPVLHQKIQALVRSWGDAPDRSGVDVGEVAPVIETPVVEAAGKKGAQKTAPAGEIMPEFAWPADDIRYQLRELLAQALELGVKPRLTQFPELTDDLLKLAQNARATQDMDALNAFTKDLKQFWFKLEVRGESDAELRDGLLRLLKLLVDNIGELVVDDVWLRGQISLVQEIIAHPINSHVLYDAEKSFKEVIFKQSALKQSLNEAKATLKSMIATFIDRIGALSESTGEYHDKIEGYATKISQTEDINQINLVLGDLSKDIRVIQMDMQRSRDDLIDARKKAEGAERKILELETELEQVSSMVREDQLTGTLNRRGMDEAFERELARADRMKLDMCVGMLDVDNFKRLNDTYGHQAGDEALLHLVKVIKETLRPMDVIARYGGEEFLIILPDTGLEEALKVTTRLQRELTKKFFLQKNERVLITFSAGVALRAPGELPDSMIDRADKALYRAKETGRNRVISAESQD